MTAMQITATGMCCAVGYTTQAASAAMRAGMDHFRETRFVDQQGELLLGAELYGIEQWGISRLAWMFQQVLQECIHQEPFFNPQQTCLLLITPELDRPGSNADSIEEIYRTCTKDYDFHERSGVIPLGKTGFADALIKANELLHNATVRKVLIAGVDSFFSSSTINYYLEQQRLLSSDNDDGFIPGEAAGAVMLSLPNHTQNALHITGVGVGEEKAHILNEDMPNRADGLHQAICSAVNDSQKPLTNTQFHMSAMGHESYYFREIELAISRSLEHKVPDYPHLMLNSSTGEVGAASGPLILSYLTSVMSRIERSGQSGLVHFSADSGQRSAVIVEWKQTTESNKG